MSAISIVGYILNRNAALLNSVPVGRQYLVRAQQDTVYPYLVINQITGVDEIILSGQGEYQRDLVQIDIVAPTFNDANNVAKLVRGALVNTIKATITQGTTLRVKDVDITATGTVVSSYTDASELIVLSCDYRVRWRYR